MNILLSFAQFERELIGERVRDKIAASKKKGMWMGGTVPLGYDVATASSSSTKPRLGPWSIFTGCIYVSSRFDHCKSSSTPPGSGASGRLRSDGTEYGNSRFSQGALYLLLQNRTYRGEATHKGNAYPASMRR